VETRVNVNDHYIQKMEGQLIEIRYQHKPYIRGLIVERYRQAYPEDAGIIDDVEFSIEMIDVLMDNGIYTFDIDDPEYNIYFSDNGVWIMEKN